MYRIFRVSDEEGKKFEFKVYPNQDNLMEITADEIDMTLNTRRNMLDMVIYASRFMSGNSINKVEIEEEEQ